MKGFCPRETRFCSRGSKGNWMKVTRRSHSVSSHRQHTEWWVTKDFPMQSTTFNPKAERGKQEKRASTTSKHRKHTQKKRPE